MHRSPPLPPSITLTTTKRERENATNRQRNILRISMPHGQRARACGGNVTFHLKFSTSPSMYTLRLHPPAANDVGSDAEHKNEWRQSRRFFSAFFFSFSFFCEGNMRFSLLLSRHRNHTVKQTRTHTQTIFCFNFFLPFCGCWCRCGCCLISKWPKTWARDNASSLFVQYSPNNIKQPNANKIVIFFWMRRTSTHVPHDESCIHYTITSSAL